MMRMMMRPQMGHLPSSIKVVGSSTQWDRRMHQHAGYKMFTCILVGGAGGFGGRSYYNSNNVCYGAGGGGGGMLRFRGNLEDLNPIVNISAGESGYDGTDKLEGQTGTAGGTGGTSSIGPENGGDAYWEAYGGAGGGGGRIDFGTKGSANLSDGGDGGFNSWWPQVGAKGEGSNGNSDTVSPVHIAATAGMASTGSSAGVVAGGGGGGETGYCKVNGQVVYAAGDAGKSGNVNANEGTTGYGGGSVSSKGGPGGGANIAMVSDSGSPEYYGSRASGSNPDGVVYLKLT